MYVLQDSMYLKCFWILKFKQGLSLVDETKAKIRNHEESQFFLTTKASLNAFFIRVSCTLNKVSYK